MLEPLLAVIPLQLLAYRNRTHARPQRRPAAQPREDRDRRVAATRLAIGGGMTAPLPDWLEPLPTPNGCGRRRLGDRQQALPSLDLMERAGAGLARLTADLAPEGAVAAVCGKGNNGGDGLVAARLPARGGPRRAGAADRAAGRTCAATRRST